jgi:hypothetical protein
MTPVALITVPATGHRRVDKRSAVHQRRHGIRWTALALVHPTAGTMIKATPVNTNLRGMSPRCRPSSGSPNGPEIRVTP